MITFFKKPLRCSGKKNQFHSSQSFILRRIRRKALLYAKDEDSFAAKTYTVLLIILSSLNMYFINLFSHICNHRCRAHLVYEEKSSLAYSTLAVSLCCCPRVADVGSTQRQRSPGPVWCPPYSRSPMANIY